MPRDKSDKTKMIERCLRQTQGGRNRWSNTYLAAIFGVSVARISTIRALSKIEYRPRAFKVKLGSAL
jgi:hypothetical protein